MLESGNSEAPRATVKENGGFDLFSGLVATKESDVCDKLRNSDINTMTPIEAMNLLYGYDEYKRLLESI